MDKTCKECGVRKNINEFYMHPKTTDGYINICKDCKRAYARSRLGLESVKESRRKWNHKNMKYIDAKARVWAKNNPEKRRAHSALWNSIASGKIVRGSSCNRCGSKVNIQAHHNDYSKPLQ